MKKEFAKRLIFGSTFLFTLFLMRFTAPLSPPSDSLGKIDLGGLSFNILDVLAVILHLAFLFGVYFILAKIIDKKMK